MSKTMLIDTAHAEETRVVVLDGHRVEEFDFETQSKKQLRGNIYLAKVTRVEPSLQAAFVEYGGNRHGFLAFNEIHPDYYQIPVEDRQRLMAELATDHDDDDDHDGEDEGELTAEEARLRRKLMRRYKIQDVIRRRQILLIQVVKEERGNKGAALTTYLSLAGRYCVLMPNTARGGGISRKITNASDRKRLKAVAQSLDVPGGMGLIVRTAGAARTKQEIRRDYEYLLRLWENIRETTLASTAPALIYEEEDLVKRAIRDLYDKDIELVLVEGEHGYHEAKDFMRMLMPSQAKKIHHYHDRTPLFVRYRVDETLSQIYTSTVPLRSGGYIVINQTEALVAIDVNSGKATKERNIETTALKTNLEAAEEACRQMRLRDLAGLIVIDFIDMEEGKNIRAIEKRVKDCLREDRARVQMGKISPFGLMEISRQRRRTGVLEGTTHVCPHCEGAGRIRTVESMALVALRAVEMEGLKGGAGAITLHLPIDVAMFVLNEKRGYLAHLYEARELHVTIAVDMALTHTEHRIERTTSLEGLAPAEPDFTPLSLKAFKIDPADEIDDQSEDEDLELLELMAAEDEGDEDEDDTDGEDGQARGRGRGRQRRRRGRRGEVEVRIRDEADQDADSDEGEEDEDDDLDASDDRSDRNRRRRRGRRGGRRMRDERRPRDAYVWIRARTPSLDAPYVWVDPFERISTYGQDKRAAAEAEDQTDTPRDTDEARAERSERPERSERSDRRDRRGRRDRGRRRGRDRHEEALGPDAPLAVAEEAAPALIMDLGQDLGAADALGLAGVVQTSDLVPETALTDLGLETGVTPRPQRARRTRKKANDEVAVASETADTVSEETETSLAPSSADGNDTVTEPVPARTRRPRRRHDEVSEPVLDPLAIINPVGDHASAHQGPSPLAPVSLVDESQVSRPARRPRRPRPGADPQASAELVTTEVQVQVPLATTTDPVSLEPAANEAFVAAEPTQEAKSVTASETIEPATVLSTPDVDPFEITGAPSKARGGWWRKKG